MPTMEMVDEVLFQPASVVECDYAQLLDIYARSSHGQHQAEQPLRYGAFEYDDRATMLGDLGEDVHPIGHMRVTHDHLTNVLAVQPELLYDVFDNPGEWRVACIATLLHDIGECTHPELEELCGAVVGDIPEGCKTDTQRGTESRVRKALYELHFPEEPEMKNGTLARAEQIIAHTPEEKDEPLHEAFEVAHRVGTYLTGLRAGSIALREMHHGSEGTKRLTQLAKLAALVTKANVPRLQSDADHYRHAAILLDRTLLLCEDIYTRFRQYAEAV